MAAFLLALQFLTIIPLKVKAVTERKISCSLIFFPVVGLLLGLVLAGLNNLLGGLGFNPLTISIVLVVALIILTGGIHLDGLADTADAFLSRRPRQEMLDVMRDSRTGALGVLALISVILLKIAFLFSINRNWILVSLVLICLLSRWSLVLSAFLFPYARREGKAKAYIEGANFRIFISATIICLICVIWLAKLAGLILMFAAAAVAWGVNRYIAKRIQGVTGDTLGAVNEIIEVFVLFAVSIIQRIIYG